MTITTRLNSTRITADCIWLSNPSESGYLFSPLGNILSLRTNQVKRKSKHCKGYEVVNINGKIKLVHRLIASIYCPNPKNKPQVNHIDGDKTNNHYLNLEWVTNQENRSHAVALGLQAKGEGAYHKLTDLEVENIRNMRKKGISGKAIALKYGISRGYVYELASTTTKRIIL